MLFRSELSDYVDQLLGHVHERQIQRVHRDVPEQLHRIACRRDDLAALFGIETNVAVQP